MDRTKKRFRWAHSAGFSLIITVDTGIAAVHEANVAKELGIDLIITDHHEPRQIARSTCDYTSEIRRWPISVSLFSWCRCCV